MQQFENVELSDGSIADNEENFDEENSNLKTKVRRYKKRKVHYRGDYVGDHATSSSDSDSDNTEDGRRRSRFTILNNNPKELSWPLWCWYYVLTVSVNTFQAAEYCGEKLADFFGITSPKYQYVINEYHRLRQEELDEEEAEKRAEEYLCQREADRIAKLESGSTVETVVENDEMPSSQTTTSVKDVNT